MIRIIKYFTLASYILFAQAQGFVHFHVHDHHDEVTFRVSVHPPDIPVDDHLPEDHDKHGHHHEMDHNHQEDHSHDDAHSEAKGDFTFRIKALNSVQIQGVSSQETFHEKISAPTGFYPVQQSLLLLGEYLPSGISSRAPPA